MQGVVRRTFLGPKEGLNITPGPHSKERTRYPDYPFRRRLSTAKSERYNHLQYLARAGKVEPAERLGAQFKTIVNTAKRYLKSSVHLR